VDERTLDWLDILGRALMWAAVIVLAFSVLGAITIGSSQSSLPLIEDVQRENRGTIALFALGGGIASAGVLAGLGAITRLLVADRRDRG
jgi:hypothetical protein